MTIDEIIIISNMAGKDKPLGVPHLDKLFNEVDTAIYYRFIYHLIQYTQPSRVIELGVMFGRCTEHMATAKLDCNVLGIDIDVNEDLLKVESRYKNLRIVQHRSTDPEILNCIKGGECDILLIDTTHDYDQVMSEVNAWLPKMKSGGVILFDDISENQSMVRAWNAIKDMFPQSISLPWLHHSGFGAVIV